LTSRPGISGPQYGDRARSNASTAPNPRYSPPFGPYNVARFTSRYVSLKPLNINGLEFVRVTQTEQWLYVPFYI
jgi:hypothetical protein